MKTFAVVDSENKGIIETIRKYFGGNIPVLSKDAGFDGYDLIVLTGYDVSFHKPQNSRVINLHPALLPSFQGEDALKKAFLSGVKVSGVTVHEVEEDNFYGRIIAQYPVLIGLTTNFCDYVQEVEIIAQKLYPLVIDSIIKDRGFDFHHLLNRGCTSSQNGCGNCSHCSGC